MLEYGELLVRKRVQPLGEVVQFLHRGGIKPEVFEIGKRIKAEDADRLKGHIISAADPCLLLGVFDLLCCSGKLQYRVERLPTEPILRGKLNSDFVSHRQLPHDFVLLADLSDYLPDGRNDGNTHSVSRHLIQSAI